MFQQSFLCGHVSGLLGETAGCHTVMRCFHHLKNCLSVFHYRQSTDYLAPACLPSFSSPSVYPSVVYQCICPAFVCMCPRELFSMSLAVMHLSAAVFHICGRFSQKGHLSPCGTALSVTSWAVYSWHVVALHGDRTTINEIPVERLGGAGCTRSLLQRLRAAYGSVG